MADGVNMVILLGNLGEDAEVVQTKGDPVVKIRMATTRSWKTADGERREDVQWHNVVWWGTGPEKVAQYLVKGKQVQVFGRLQHRSYEDRDGAKRTATEVYAERVILLGGGRDAPARAERRDEPRGEAPPRRPQAQPPRQQARPSGNGNGNGGSQEPRRAAPRPQRAPDPEPPPADEVFADGQPDDDIPF